MPPPRPDLATPERDASDPGDDAGASDCPAAVGKLGQDLLNALYGCIKGHTVLGYDAGRDAMFLANSDPANNYTVECIYTGRKAPQVKDRASANANKLNAALKDIINRYHAFELPKVWGEGKSAAADGTKFDMFDQNLLAEYHIRYGGYGGIAYHHVADNYVALFSHFIPCGVWEAVYIIEGL